MDGFPRGVSGVRAVEAVVQEVLPFAPDSAHHQDMAVSHVMEPALRHVLVIESIVQVNYDICHSPALQFIVGTTT